MRTFLTAVALLALALATFGGPAAPSRQAKITEVRVCPIMMEPVNGSRPLSVAWDKYRVCFCCPSCKPKFGALSAKQKAAAVRAALAKQVRK